MYFKNFFTGLMYFYTLFMFFLLYYIQEVYLMKKKKIEDEHASELLRYQGTLLRQLRKNTSYTMEDVANRFCKTKSWISEIENGRNNISSIDLVKLISMYEADINDFTQKIQKKMDEK